MESLIWVVHVLTAIILIGLVLVQHGKGADMGAAFGSGSAGSLFGSTGSANFLSRSTAVAATIFFITSLALTYFYSRPAQDQGVMSKHENILDTKKEEKGLNTLIPGQAAIAPAATTASQPVAAQTGTAEQKSGAVPK
ncbi:MAG: preprotein translocase subunit SecG [Nitrosomonadales bacterium]|nr:preprotein translocase subunit SecG [Nitrosomonadales bacterium]